MNVLGDRLELLPSLFTLDLVLSYKDKIWVLWMGTNCAPLVTDVLLFCYERDFMMSFCSGNKEAEIIKDFISKSRYLDDLSKH